MDRFFAIVNPAAGGGRSAKLAGPALARVLAPTLLIVGGRDDTVLDLNRRALACITADKQLEVVPAATHLFEEPGALERVAALASGWFTRHLHGRREAGTVSRRGRSG